MQKDEDELLGWCIRVLKQELSKMQSVGLMNGKMGVCLAMYHFESLISCTNATILGDSLVDDIFRNISKNLTLDFSDSLGGIGWGLGHALQQKFVEGDADDLLIDVDKKYMLSLVYKKPGELGLMSGMSGYGFYFLSRIKCNNAHDEHFFTITNKYCLEKTIKHIEQLLGQLNFNIDEPEEFSFFWDLPVLIFLMAECITGKVCVKNATAITRKLVTAANNKGSMRASSRLLLWLVSKYFCFKTGISLLLDIDAPNVYDLNEVKNDLNERYGIDGASGIALLYHMIFKNSQDLNMRKQALYWLEQASQSMKNTKNDFEAERVCLIHHLGLLNGIPGFILAKSIVSPKSLKTYGNHN